MPSLDEIYEQIEAEEGGAGENGGSAVSEPANEAPASAGSGGEASDDKAADGEEAFPAQGEEFDFVRDTIEPDEDELPPGEFRCGRRGARTRT